MIDYRISAQLMTTTRGVLVAKIPRVVEVEYTKVLGDVGECTVRFQRDVLGETEPQSLINGFVKLSITGVDGVFQLGTNDEGTFVIKKVDVSTESDGREYITLTAYDYNILLESRIIAYRTESSYTTKTGKVDDLMRAIVRENMGALQTVDFDGNADTTRQISDMTVGVDKGLGDTVYITGIEWQPVLETLLALQAQSASLGNEIFFGMYSDSVDNTPVFDTKYPLWGSDKSATVVFGRERGNLKQPRIVYDYKGAVTDDFAIEHGNANNRRIFKNTNSAVSQDNDFAKVESLSSLGSVDPNGANVSDQADSVSESTFASKRPKIKFDGQIIATGATPYLFGNFGWGLGDKVKVVVTGLTSAFTPIVRAVRVRLQNDGRVDVTARVEVVQ